MAFVNTGEDSPRITYRCAACGAEDSARADEHVLALRCWSCGIGGKPEHSMGMFPQYEREDAELN